MLNVDEAKLQKAVAEIVADRMMDENGIADEVRKNVDARIAKLFVERVDGIIQAAIDAAVHEGFEREYQRVTTWGEAQGPKTTIKKELRRIVGDFWSERVSVSSGQKTDSTHNSVSRAEYTMMKVCSEKFSENLKQHALNITGHLKDGLRNQMGKHMDNMLNELFRVKSLQDQGKVEKPY